LFAAYLTYDDHDDDDNDALENFLSQAWMKAAMTSWPTLSHTDK
jgi:hypothetical protein